MSTVTASPARQFLGGADVESASAEQRLAFCQTEFQRADGPFRGAFEYAAIGTAALGVATYALH